MSFKGDKASGNLSLLGEVKIQLATDVQQFDKAQNAQHYILLIGTTDEQHRFRPTHKRAGVCESRS